MQNFSAQDITYTNYKEKLDMVLKNCKQNEINFKNQQRRSISRSNSKDKSLNTKVKLAPNGTKQVLQSQSSQVQQQSSKKNLVKNIKNLQIATSHDKKQNSSNKQSNSKQIGNGNNTCTNVNRTNQFLFQTTLSGAQSVQNKATSKSINNPLSCKNQKSSHQINTVSNNNQQQNTINASLYGSDQQQNLSSFFSSQSTKTHIKNNLLSNSIQVPYGSVTKAQSQAINESSQYASGSVNSAQKQISNNHKISLFLQHLQNNDSPIKQIQQIQDQLQSYQQNNSFLQNQNQGISNTFNSINPNLNQQQNLNSSINSNTLNLNNSYSIIQTNTMNPSEQQSIKQLQQSLHQRQRIFSNDCVFNINSSLNGAQNNQFDGQRGISASCSHQESIQFQQNTEQKSTHSKQFQGVPQVDLKLNIQNKQIKNSNQSPLYNPYVQRHKAYSVHSNQSSTDPQKCLLMQFEDQFSPSQPSQSIAYQQKFIDLSGANIQISDIVLDKNLNVSDIYNSSENSKQMLQQQQLINNIDYKYPQSQQNQSDNFDDFSNNDGYNDKLIASTPVNCNIGICNEDEEYLRTPKQNNYSSKIKQNLQQPYQHTPITHNQLKQSFKQTQDERQRSKSFADSESLMINQIPFQTQQQQEANPTNMFQKRRAFTIVDDSYTVLKVEDSQSYQQGSQTYQQVSQSLPLGYQINNLNSQTLNSQINNLGPSSNFISLTNNLGFEESMQLNQTYNNQNNYKFSRKVNVPKIKNFDQMIEEKNQQIDFEIPPHVYNETFEGEEYCSSYATSELRSGIHDKGVDSLNDTQNLDNTENGDNINSLQNTLKQNPILEYRNMLKQIEYNGEDRDAEVKALKITLRKLQYRDAILRQKITQMMIQQTEQNQIISKLDADNKELVNQLNSYIEQHEIYESQITHLQCEMQQFQSQITQIQDKSQNSQQQNQIKEQISQYEQLIDQLRQQLQKSEQTIEGLRFEQVNHQDQKDNLQSQLNLREEEFQAQQYEFLEKLAEFQEENIKLNQLLNKKTQEQQILQNEEKLNFSNKQNQELNEQIIQLNSENEKLYEQITSLLKENDQYKSQKGIVHNINDLSIKPLKLLDDNAKLIEENRAIQTNFLILTEENKQLQENILNLQIQLKQIQGTQKPVDLLNQQSLDENKYSQLVQESQILIKDLNQANNDLLQNNRTIELKNNELNKHCRHLEQQINTHVNEINKLNSFIKSKVGEEIKSEKSLQEVINSIIYNSLNYILNQQIVNLQKEVHVEREKNESLEKKIILISQKNSLNQSMISKDHQNEEVIKIRLENDELRKELQDQQRERECLEEVLKNYLLQRELEKLKTSGDQKILKDQDQDDDIAAAFQSDIKTNAFLNSQKKSNIDHNSQLLNYFSNSNQNKGIYSSDYNMFKRNSNCTITNGNNTNYQISITECSQISLLDEDAGAHIRVNGDESCGMEANEELREMQQYKRNNQDSNLNHITSTNTNINNNNNNNTNQSNNILKKSSTSSSNFLREIDSNIQILINNNSNNTLLNNIQHLLNTSSSSNLLSKENTPIHPQYQYLNNLQQSHQQISVPSNNQPQLHMSHQNLSIKPVFQAQILKENEHSLNNFSQTLEQSSFQKTCFQIPQQFKNMNEKAGVSQSLVKSQIQQTFSNAYQINSNNKENQNSKAH